MGRARGNATQADETDKAQGKKKKCPHEDQDARGSNHYERRITCRACGKVMAKISMKCDVSLLEKAFESVSIAAGAAEKASDDAADCASGAAKSNDAPDVGADGGAKCNDAADCDLGFKFV